MVNNVNITNLTLAFKTLLLFTYYHPDISILLSLTVQYSLHCV